MPEHSETTPTRSIVESMVSYMEQLSTASGQTIVAVSAENLLPLDDTWIVTTTTPQGTREDWRVQVIKDATP